MTFPKSEVVDTVQINGLWSRMADGSMVGHLRHRDQLCKISVTRRAKCNVHHERICG